MWFTVIRANVKDHVSKRAPIDESLTLVDRIEAKWLLETSSRQAGID